MITASHNPYRDNGVKIFDVGGAKLTNEIERAIEAAMGPPPSASLPPDIDHAAAVGEYCDYLVDTVTTRALDGLTIVLDCANGGMYEVAPAAARRLGADVIVINAEPNGRNIN